MEKPVRIKTITELHQIMGLPKPQHPLIELIDLSQQKKDTGISAVIFDLYVITLKRGCNKLFYGQQQYDFDEGVMAFLSPGQILRGESNQMPQQIDGWMLFIHPDFLWNTALAKKIKQFEFFGYNTHEALFLSDKEEKTIKGIVENIKNEYQANIDQFSQDIIISQVETMLNYAERFYQRQFITRKKTNHQILDRLEGLLSAYFDSGEVVAKGLPTVPYIADHLNVSPTYLRSLLKTLTGMNTQQHIHEKLIEKAKEKLSATDLTVSEIAYQLGFEHMQSFSKLFKTKTNVSPLAFRQSFN